MSRVLVIVALLAAGLGGGSLLAATGGSVGAGQGNVRTGGTTSPFVVTPPPGGGGGIGMGIIPDDPEVQHAAYRKKAEDDYNAGLKAKAAGDLETAVRLLSGVVELSKMRIDSPYPEKAYAELEVIEAQAKQELAVARSLVAGTDPAAGLGELKRIVRVYFGLPTAKVAGTLVRQLEADPAFQASLRAARLTVEVKRAETLETQAAALLEPPAPPSPDVKTPPAKVLSEQERQAARLAKLLEAYEIYGRVVEQGAGTDPAKTAAASRTRLEQDKDLMVLLKQVQAERKAREWLGLANAYFKAGSNDRAREFCQKILSECPQSPQAADAKALLDQMK
jgi:tetratricopeptide (TPR) repeat protein